MSSTTSSRSVAPLRGSRAHLMTHDRPDIVPSSSARTRAAPANTRLLPPGANVFKEVEVVRRRAVVQRISDSAADRWVARRRSAIR